MSDIFPEFTTEKSLAWPGLGFQRSKYLYIIYINEEKPVPPLGRWTEPALTSSARGGSGGANLLLVRRDNVLTENVR